MKTALTVGFLMTALSVPGIVRHQQIVSTTIVISEFRTRGPNGGNDEFIELYNLSSSPVNIGNWQVKGSNSSGTVTNRANIDSGTVLNAGCHYLLTNSNPTGGPYSGSVVGNQTYGVGVTDDGGVAVAMPDGTIVDQVGLSNGSALKEGTPLSPLTSESNRSYERKPGGASGNGQDTDNNQADFALRITSLPENAESTCLGSPPPPPPPPPTQCGVERWSVKTGTDADAALVNVASVMPTTITIMRSWMTPNPIPLTTRVPPFETSVWTIVGTLTLYKLEEDSDYHVVVRDEAGNTIITEIPCPCCVGATSPFASAIANARADFDARFGARPFFQTANAPVLITGVGFFDFPHGQTGAAPNGIEIHPVLGIEFITDARAPRIIGASVSGKKLLVAGLNFDEGASVLIDGKKQKKTSNDGEQPWNLLVAKKSGKQISRGGTVTLQVRNLDGTLSNEFSFTRP